MSSMTTIPFVDTDSGDEGFFGVRVQQGVVGLTVSLSSNGDIEVFVGQSEVEALLEALQGAVHSISNRDSDGSR